MIKPKLLLHACCGPCATVALEELTKNYDVAVFFSGNNFDSKTESDKRLEALRVVAGEIGNVNIICVPYDHSIFLKAIKGFESNPEGGDRCEICIKQRLQLAARYARENGFEFFTTSLSVSPYKKAKLINQIGCRLAEEHDLTFLSLDLKKNNGFARSVTLSKQLGIYRQGYCGCEFSVHGAFNKKQ